MSKTWVVSDTHFSHRADFIVKSRGFSSVDEMNEKLISNWNEVISDNDVVYHLGDVVFQPATQTELILPRLKGKKILILGNHDKGKILFKYFEDFYSILEHDIFVFSHIPLSEHEMNERFLGKINVHGHTHLNYKNQRNDPKYICVNLEFTNYFPIETKNIINTLQPNFRKETILYLIRGIPGSGKTYLAKEVINNYKHTINHFEADMFFELSGSYNFDRSKLNDAHLWCYANTADKLIKNESCIVANTFTTKWELSKYINLASKLGVEVKIVKCEGNFKSIHDVPDDTVEKMKERWENCKEEITETKLKENLTDK